MNPLTKQHLYTIFVCDNSLEGFNNSQLIDTCKFLCPDKIVTTSPVEHLETYNLYNSKSQHLLSDIYITNDNCTDLESNNRYIKITRDITHRFHSKDNTYLLIGTGKEYENFTRTKRQWFGKQGQIPWIIPHYECTDISYCVLYINKATNALHSGIHNFAWMFWSSKCFYDSPNNIFSNDFRLEDNKPDLSVISYK